MTKETIELIVKVDIWYVKDQMDTRKRAIDAAKDIVVAASCSYAEPKSAKLYKSK